MRFFFFMLVLDFSPTLEHVSWGLESHIAFLERERDKGRDKDGDADWGNVRDSLV